MDPIVLMLVGACLFTPGLMLAFIHLCRGYISVRLSRPTSIALAAMALGVAPLAHGFNLHIDESVAASRVADAREDRIAATRDRELMDRIAAAQNTLRDRHGRYSTSRLDIYTTDPSIERSVKRRYMEFTLTAGEVTGKVRVAVRSPRGQRTVRILKQPSV